MTADQPVSGQRAIREVKVDVSRGIAPIRCGSCGHLLFRVVDIRDTITVEAKCGGCHKVSPVKLKPSHP